MNTIIHTEKAATVCGIEGRKFNVVANTETGRILNQEIMVSRSWAEKGRTMRLAVTLRFDDECHHGHETFAITANLYDSSVRREGGLVSGGCLHDEIAARFPELAHLIKWHLASKDGPLHYVANTVYHAGDRDCNGLQKGEVKQIKNGRTGLPCWRLETVEGAELPTYADATECPQGTLTRRYMPLNRIGEGKDRDLQAARDCAVWPDATDEELMLPKAELTAKLVARLPALLVEFKADMLAVGFVWPGVAAQGVAA